MTTMTIDQAKDHLDELLAKAANGEEVVIVRDDGVTFTLVTSAQDPRKRRGFVGSLEGKIRMAPDFDEIPEGFEPYLGDEAGTSGEGADVSSSPGLPADQTAPIQRRPRRESYGILKGKIWMAPDFDDIPEGFEPYLGDEPTSSDTAQCGEQGGDPPSPTPLKDRSELFGILKGRVRMADDFDEIPEGFEPYLGDNVDKTG